MIIFVFSKKINVVNQECIRNKIIYSYVTANGDRDIDKKKKNIHNKLENITCYVHSNRLSI